MRLKTIKYLLLLVGLMISLHASADVEVNATNFPNEKFRNWVLQHVSGASDGVLTDAEIEKVKDINCSHSGMITLQGIEYFTALTTLTCHYNQLTSLDVSKNTALTSLSCYSNQLTSLDVSKNTALTSLSCGGNKLTSLDVSKNTALTYLSCYSNQLTSLDVSKNTALTRLWCYSNQLTTLDVSKNTALTRLECYSNQLTSLDVSNNTALTSLYCYSNQLMSLDLSKNSSISYTFSYSLSSQSLSQKVVSTAAGVAIPVPSEFELAKVSDLRLAGEIVTGSITTVNGQKYLVFAPIGTQENSYNWKFLSYNYDCGNSRTGVMGVRVLLTTASTSDVEINATNFPDEKFRNWIVANISGANDYLLTPTEIAMISSISCGNNRITSLQGIEFFVGLTTLYCHSNQLTTLDVSKNTALEELDCSSNQFTSLTINHETLKRLECRNLQLTSLDVSGCTALEWLDCSENELTTLTINNETLRVLYCGSNQLTSLNLIGEEGRIAGNITTLDCSYNQLASLNISYLRLSTLRCYANQLTSLDVSQNTNLTELECGGNRLTSLDVSQNTRLERLDCSGNMLTSLDVSNIKGNGKPLQLECGGQYPTLKAIEVSSGIAICMPSGFDFSKMSDLKVGSTSVSITTTNIGNRQYLVLDKSLPYHNSGLSYTYDTGNSVSMDVSINIIDSYPIAIDWDIFPDEKFRNWVIENVSGASDGYLTEAEIESVKEITIRGYDYGSPKMGAGIGSLKGIEYFTALTKLECPDNQLTDLDVSQNTALTELDCGGNKLASLDVSNNTALKKLICGSEQLTSLDVSKNTALTYLSCWGNFTSLDVSQNTALTYLSCSGNFTSLDVSQNTALEYLRCSYNQLTNLDVSGCTALTELNCGGNKLASLDVSQNTALTRLDCYSNQLTTLDVSQNTALTRLVCYSNQLTTLDVSNNTALTSLSCYSNQLTSLDLSKNTALASLSCYSNQLTTLDVSNNTALTYLSCYSNQLTSLDVSQNTALTSLSCYSNQLTSLDVSQNTVLTRLECYSNQLTSLDVSQNTALKSLSCYSNQLTSLDVSQNTELKELRCSSNQLTSLDVSQNTELKELRCSSNQLTSLDLSKNTALASLSCYSNQLTTLDVSNNTALTSLSCYSNQLTCLDLSKNTSILYSYNCSLSSQSFSQKIVNISTEVAIPVPAEFDLTKVSDLKLAGEIVSGNITTVNGQKYLVFAPVGTQESSVNWKLLSYKYDSGNSNAGMMEVRVLLTTASTSDVEINATNFPDEKFRNWIVANISGANDYLLTPAEIAKISSINCSNKSINSLQGIEFFVGLTSLYCYSNQLMSLDLSKNTSISSSSLGSQYLSQKIVSTSAGIGILAPSDFAFSRVLNLKLAESAIDGKVVTMDGQKYLVFAQKGTDERTLKGLKLTYSYATDDSNKRSMDVAIVLSYGDPLKVDATNFPDDVFRNWIIENVSGAKDSILTDEEISKVTNINCSNQGISSLQGIEFFTPLTSLYCSSNQLTSLDVSNNMALASLWCSSNQLTSLDVSNNTALTTLNCHSNQLASLDASKNTALTSLYCYSNQLTSLNVSNNRFLKNIQCQNNQLMNLDLVNNTALVSSSSTQITPQSLSLMAVNTSAGIAIPVPSGFDITKLSNLKLADASVTGSMTTIDGQAYLVFAEKGTDENAINGKELTYSYNTGNELEKVAAMNVTVMLSYAATTYTLSIQSSIGGSVSYNGATVVNTTRSFVVREYATAIITISPNNRYRLASLLVNDVDVTSTVSNNQFTISDITKNTSVVATFAEILENFSQEGVNYNMTSIANKTLNVGKGNYSGHVVIPATVSYDGDTWTVAGVVDGAFNLSAITAITWNPNTAIGDGAFGTQTNPNLLLYVKSEAYAPSNVQNVIANGRAKKIVLTDAASGNDFNCPEAFTAEEISYTHRYGMTTGIGECRGWETIALPFDVKQFTHESKGTLIPFKVFSSTSAGKPFWLYRLTASGWQEAANIEANTPYIISLPNNKVYDNDYNLPGVMTFSSSYVTVPVTEVVRSTFGDRTFVANFTSQSASWSIYALNVNNDLSSYSDYLPEGSTFIRELRTVHPFEAYMTNSSGNAKQFFPLFETLPTAIREIPIQGVRSVKGVRIYSMSGELIMFDENISIEEALKRLKRGVYFVNGKKMVVNK